MRSTTARLLLVPITCFLITGCGAVSFDVSQDLAEQRVKGSANPLSGLLPDFLVAVPITVDLRAETAKRNTGPATSAFLKELTLSATPHESPSGNFDFLSEVHVFVAPSQGGSLPRVEIATLKPVPRGQTKVVFTIVPDIDLLPYINAGAQITAEATGTTPTKDFTYDGRVVITVRI